MVINAKKAAVLVLLAGLVIAGIFGVRYCTDYFYKLNYPRDYEIYVQRYSEEFGMDPDIVYAIIKTESDFEPDATSKVGARGLMQMMKDTFEWVQTKIQDPEVSFDNMYDPEANIRYGTYLIAYLYQEFGRYDTALAAYHAGRTATAKWLADPEYSSDGKKLDRIPISDTGHYVDKVMKCYEMYQKIYESEKDGR